MDTNGTLDVVGTSAATDSGFVAWWKWNSSGGAGWQMGDTIAEDLDQPLNTAVADMDGDGDMDVVATHYGPFNADEGALVLYTNLNGVGTSWDADTLAIIPHAYAVAADTLNLDSYMDIVVTSADVQELNNEGVFILYGDANGDFSNTETLYYRNQLADFLSPRSVRVARFNQDNLKDIIVAFTGDQDETDHHGIIIWYASQVGNDVVWDSTQVDIFPDFTTCRDIYVVDMDDDGDMDFVASSLFADRIDCFLNDYPDWDEFKLGYSTTVKGIGVADYTDDGYLDVVSASYNGAPYPNGRTIWLHTNPGDVDNPVDCTMSMSSDSEGEPGGTLSYSYSFTLADSSEYELLAWYKIVTPGFHIFAQPTPDTLGVAPGTYTGRGLVDLPDSIEPCDSCWFFVSVGYPVRDESVDTPVEFLHGLTTAETKIAVTFPANDLRGTGGEQVTATGIPLTYALVDLKPNPFNASGSFAVTLPEPSQLHATVYNITGQRVASIADGIYEPGRHEFVFDGQNLASGMYFLRVDVPGHLGEMRKLTLMK